MGRKGKRKAKGGSHGGAQGGGSSKDEDNKPVESPCEIEECSIRTQTQNPTAAKDEEQQDCQVEKPAPATSEGLSIGGFPGDLASELESLVITPSRPGSSAEHGDSAARSQFGSFLDVGAISLQLKTPKEPEYRGSICFGSISVIRQKSTATLKPVNRPDGGGKSFERTVNLLVNHFRVDFRPEQKIFHYDFDIQKKSSASKGKEKTTTTVSKEDGMEIKKRLGENFEDFRNAVYDGKKNVYSSVPLPQGKHTVELHRYEDSAPKEYIVSLKSTSHELSMQSLVSYLDTKNKEPLQLEQDLMQAMDLVLREHPASTRIMVGRSLYPKLPDPNCNIGDGLVASRGFYQSLRLTAQGLILNVDYSVVAFRKSIPVLDYLWESSSIDCSKPLSDEYRWWAQEALKGLKIRVTHRKSTQKFTIKCLTKKITRDIQFEKGQELIMTNIVDHFKKEYNRNINFKHLPCLDISKTRDKPVYVPMEFCEICEGQKVAKEKLSPTQSRNFQRIACPPAPERLQRTMDIMRSPDGPREGAFSSEFNLTVGADMTRVTGRVLAPPRLKLGGRDAQVTLNKDNRQWNLMNSYVFDGKPMDKWGVLYFSWKRPSNWHFTILESFTTSLVKRCVDIGIKIAPNPLLNEFTPMDYFSDSQRLKQTLENTHYKTEGQLKILICIMEEKHPGYNTLKYIAETKIGLLTQCCLVEHVEKCSKTSDRKMMSQSSQYLANFALKMNAKLGGSNTTLDLQHFSRQLPRFAKSHVLYMGADVNHPGAGDKKSPSVAALVGSINWPLCTNYMAKIRYQNHRQEHIEHLESMSRELLQEYWNINKRLPDKIVFFRDGVSESQFEMVRDKELSSLKEAISHFQGYDPAISLIVAQKRHHTRFFPQREEDSTQHGNVPAGTVVDTEIVHPREYDFFLCSHYGLLGTSKPTHYHVLWDEIGFGSDELQILINSLCYTFARCTKPVSLVPPVYYADLAAYRGRQYVEALISSSETSSSSSSSSSGLANYPEIQEAINKSMFFC